MKTNTLAKLILCVFSIILMIGIFMMLFGVGMLLLKKIMSQNFEVELIVWGLTLAGIGLFAGLISIARVAHIEEKLNEKRGNESGEKHPGNQGGSNQGLRG